MNTTVDTVLELIESAGDMIRGHEISREEADDIQIAINNFGLVMRAAIRPEEITHRHWDRTIWND